MPENGQSQAKNSADYTAGVKVGRTADGGYVVLDVKRFRGTPDQVEHAIVSTAHEDGRSTTVGLPKDPGQAGAMQVLYLTRKLAGFRVDSSPESGAKEIRAMPVASQANAGNLSLLRALWNNQFLDELLTFPVGRHDDGVDALSRAFGMIIQPPPPARRCHIPFMGR
jgi:predicted phage terminase large subunit-like protein